MKIFDMIGVFVLAGVAGGAGGAGLLFLTQYSQCGKDLTCAIERSGNVLIGGSSGKSEDFGEVCLSRQDSESLWNHVMLMSGGRAEDELNFSSAWDNMDNSCKTTAYVLQRACISMSIPGGLAGSDYCDQIQ